MDVDGASGGGEKLPVLTREVLKGWQKALLEVPFHSLGRGAGLLTD